MSEVNNQLFDTIDRQHAGLPASTRRALVKTTAGALGTMGLLGYASSSAFATVKTADANSVENITTVAATAEVLATIVNTVGAEKLSGKLDAVTLRNIRAAAQQEKNHYELLTSSAVGGKPATTTIYVPDEVFASPENLLTTLVVGDQVFINAYLLATTVFARQGNLMGSKFARYSAEIMATEAVHRALALQSLGKLGVPQAAVREPDGGGAVALLEVDLDERAPRVAVPDPGERQAVRRLDLRVAPAAAVVDVALRIAHDDAHGAADAQVDLGLRGLPADLGLPPAAHHGRAGPGVEHPLRRSRAVCHCGADTTGGRFTAPPSGSRRRHRTGAPSRRAADPSSRPPR